MAADWFCQGALEAGDLAALNEQFRAWVARQLGRTGVVDLTEGCQAYIKHREGLPGATPPITASAPSFTLASKIPAGDASFFAKSTALPFAPKIPSPVTDAAQAAGASEPAAGAEGEGGDEEDIDPEVG